MFRGIMRNPMKSLYIKVALNNDTARSKVFVLNEYFWCCVDE